MSGTQITLPAHRGRILNADDIDMDKLKAESVRMWPNSVRMQDQWLRQTEQLIREGKHALINGGWGAA